MMTDKLLGHITVLHMLMRPIVTDQVVWSVYQSVGRSVGRSVCLSVTVMNPAKMDEPIKMPFGLRIHVGPRNHVLGGVHTGATWRIPLNHPCVAAMWPSCQFTLATCYGHPME